MKVGDYKVRWSYMTVDHDLKMTTCTVLKDDTVISTGKATQHPNDSHCKDTGRKLSLMRALQDGFPKKDRGSFWERYRTLTKTPRW